VLWETASGKPRGRIQAGKDNAVRALHFHPGGRTLIGGCDDGTIRFWDPIHGGELHRLTGHRGGVFSLALSGDGQVLVSGSQDTTALVWSVPTAGNDRPAQAAAPEARQMEEWWNDLAGTDAHKAFQAIQTLSAAPGPALPLLRERLQPVPAPDTATLARWLNELDSDQFDVRKRAEEELEKLGSLARPILRRALATNPSLQA